MSNLNLKFIVIGVLTVSVLLIVGAAIFSQIKTPLQPTQNQPSQQAETAPEERSAGGGLAGGGTSAGNTFSGEKPAPSNITYSRAQIISISENEIVLETEEKETLNIPLDKLSNRLSDTDISQLEAGDTVLLRVSKDQSNNLSEAEIFIYDNLEEK